MDAPATRRSSDNGQRPDPSVGYRRREYESIVVGAGAVGTSTAYHLSAKPGRTLVLERFYENHPNGSSHGRSRILRTAYAEGPSYVPLVLRSRTLWQGLGREVGQEIFRPTGVLLAGPRGAVALARAAASARRYGLPHELLEENAAEQRFPTFRFSRGDAALWDPGGGVLFPERAIRAYRRRAHRRGGAFRWNSPVLRWTPLARGRVLIVTPRREYVAEKVVLSAGAWLPELVPDLRLRLTVEQQTVYWFFPDGRSRKAFREMPAFVWYDHRRDHYYGTPDLGDGVKVGGSRGQMIRDPSRRPPTSAREFRSVAGFVRGRIPGLSTRPRQRTRCLYTNRPDRNFLVGLHPDCPDVVLVSACSGHGFKFASALGEQLARLVTTGRVPPLLAPFWRTPERAPRGPDV